MPNWVYNTLYMEGIGKADLYSTEIVDGVERKRFDFNKLIPEPMTEEECREKYGGDKFIDNDDHHLEHDDGREWFNWYDWHVKYWGTKWNAVETIIDDDDTIRFQTAWGAPEQIFRAITRMFPGKELDVNVDYETGEMYELEYLNGECIREEEIIIDTSEE